jgi:hypothetical protein
MGRSVVLSDVVPEIERFGALATLITVGELGEPHLGSVLVEVGDEHLLVRVGPTTAANMSRRPAVSLTWLPSSSGEYQLIVDGLAEPDGAADGDGLIPVRVEVLRGILHRLAGRSDAGPTCLPLRNGTGAGPGRT